MIRRWVSRTAWSPRVRVSINPTQPTTIGEIHSETHPTGRSKARFFRALGFDDANVESLASSLISSAKLGKLVGTEESSYGTKHAIQGDLVTPMGRIVRVVTVWIVEAGQSVPRFVTAYPAD